MDRRIRGQLHRYSVKTVVVGVRQVNAEDTVSGHHHAVHVRARGAGKRDTLCEAPANGTVVDVHVRLRTHLDAYTGGCEGGKTVGWPGDGVPSQVEVDVVCQD